jgi:8-oxo-dGTP pyrophosphatase MutT (NUDIX family)
MTQTGTDNDAGTCCQVAALPWRADADGKIRILLVTSRTNGKWMLPKGWPIKGKSEAEAALTEAQEEAGIDGTVSPMPIGSYHYLKHFDDGTTKSAQAAVYAVRVKSEWGIWDERSERKRKWFRPKKAAQVAFEPDLKRFLADLSEERIVLF